MTDCLPHSDDRALAATRTFTHKTLAGWGLDDLLDRRPLMVSELTANAERTAGPLATSPSRHASASP
ncbi:hypothetical protein ACODT5_11080 [Streptomyces sp. 5.8]|uniref:hypothetical protein n=1 Tax=Streptomyces sp. 5.8 TaxID=3406571 RepID=UPI003BB81395